MSLEQLLIEQNLDTAPWVLNLKLWHLSNLTTQTYGIIILFVFFILFYSSFLWENVEGRTVESHGIRSLQLLTLNLNQTKANKG